MSDVWLGRTPPPTANRDATHVAVVPMVAGTELRPGEHVGLEPSSVDGLMRAAAMAPAACIGIVDPFLSGPVHAGDRFYLCLYPQSVTGLRHVYKHPTLDAAEGSADSRRADSERWLRAFCDASDCPGYEAVIGKAMEHQSRGADWDDDGEYLHWNGSDAHGEIPSEFWEHFEVVTGVKPTRRARAFSCAC